MDNIIEVGRISADIEYYYSLMNLFVLPTKREGLGTSLLEASSMNLPIITNGSTGEVGMPLLKILLDYFLKYL